MAEIRAAKVGIEARHGQDNPIGVFGLVGAVVGYLSLLKYSYLTP